MERRFHCIKSTMSCPKRGTFPADQLERARKTAVDRLIDQELLAAKAVEEKLDRTPETLMAIELARREILARARVQQLMAAAPKLTPGDVTKYYVTHPELFAERQVYSLQEITFPTQKRGVADVQALVDKGAAMNDIQELLRESQCAVWHQCRHSRSGAAADGHAQGAAWHQGGRDAAEQQPARPYRRQGGRNPKSAGR
jgi:EpsD family peptidyl-prolyl cis-trans isomerase